MVGITSPTGPNPHPAPSVRWTVEQRDRALLLCGEFDVDSRADLAVATAVFARRCIAWHGSSVGSNRSAGVEAVIDAGEMRFIDACTLGVLVDLHRTLAEAGIRLRTRRPTAMLRRLSDVCGLDVVVGLDPPPASHETADALADVGERSEGRRPTPSPGRRRSMLLPHIGARL